MSTVGDMLAKIQQNKTDVKPIRPIVEAPIQAIDDWGISKRTCTLYGYRSTDKNHYADFKDKDGQTVAQHVRRLEPKGFSWVGERPKPMQLFGQNLGNQGTLIICEGEKDCLCVRELLTVRESQTWVVVSIPDGVTSAVQSIKPHLSWVLGFESVRILFDTDKPGVTNAQKVAELIGPKARIVTGLGEYKDAADAWLAGDKATLKLAIMQAKKHRPDGVVAAVDLMEQVLHPKIHRGHDFPWKGWNDCTEGLKPGEVHMIAGGTGIGKSLFSRSIGLRLCMTGVRVAYLGFEESTSCTYERMISECMGQAMYRRPEEWRVEHQQEIRDAAKTFAQNLFLIDKFGSIDFDVFFANVRHYVLSEQCSVVILDHFSITSFPNDTSKLQLPFGPAMDRNPDDPDGEKIQSETETIFKFKRKLEYTSKKTGKVMQRSAPTIYDASGKVVNDQIQNIGWGSIGRVYYKALPYTYLKKPGITLALEGFQIKELKAGGGSSSGPVAPIEGGGWEAPPSNAIDMTDTSGNFFELDE